MYRYYKKIKTSIIAGLLVVILATFIACTAEQKEIVDLPFDAETVPMISSDSVTMFISDSGLIRYKLVAKTWNFFENSKDPHWFFPEGFYIEEFDTTLQIKSTLKADTVWNFTQRKLWKLKGHVQMKNVLGETFKSEELFWDQRTQKVYSDKYIEIDRPGKLLLKGRGFDSNQQMTTYTIRRPYDSDIYMDEDKGDDLNK